MVTIAKDIEKTFVFLAACVVLLCDNLEAGRIRRAVEVQVVSPTEFKLTLPEGKLLHIEVKVNRNAELGRGRIDFERNETDDQTLQFSNENLNLKKGDEIYYNGVFKRHDTPFGEGGVYYFDGNFQNATRRKRETPEEPTAESTTQVIESRFARVKKHWWKRPHYSHRRHFGHHGHLHGHPPGPLLFPHRPALWGFGHVGKYGDHGPWDGHGGEEDFYDWQLNNNNKEDDNNNEKNDDQTADSEGNKPEEIPEPWTGEDEGKNTVPDEKVPDVKPVYETPDATDVAPPVWNSTAANGNNQNSTSGSSNGTAETQPDLTTTEQIPDIDIRFPEIDDDE